jgi:Neuraminidase (sialidase)
MESDKRKRFKRLAAQRTEKVLQKLHVLGNCSNRSSYEYSEEDISKIFSEIDKAVKNTKSRFNYPRKRSQFKL